MSQGDDLAALTRAASLGDQEAWGRLVDRFSGLVWAVVRSFRLDADAAADVSQTTWLRLVEHLDDIREPGRLGSWLATCSATSVTGRYGGPSRRCRPAAASSCAC
jgi:DNA-directed RNA polymerase specialized sigma24 family protein